MWVSRIITGRPLKNWRYSISLERKLKNERIDIWETPQFWHSAFHTAFWVLLNLPCWIGEVKHDCVIITQWSDKGLAALKIEYHSRINAWLGWHNWTGTARHQLERTFWPSWNSIGWTGVWPINSQKLWIKHCLNCCVQLIDAGSASWKLYFIPCLNEIQIFFCIKFNIVHQKHHSPRLALHQNNLKETTFYLVLMADLGHQ